MSNHTEHFFSAHKLDNKVHNKVHNKVDNKEEKNYEMILSLNTNNVHGISDTLSRMRQQVYQGPHPQLLRLHADDIESKPYASNDVDRNLSNENWYANNCELNNNY